MKLSERSHAGIQVIAFALAALAVWFVKMPCWGKIYEPKMPDQLKSEI